LKKRAGAVDESQLLDQKEGNGANTCGKGTTEDQGRDTGGLENESAGAHSTRTGGKSRFMHYNLREESRTIDNQELGFGKGRRENPSAQKTRGDLCGGLLAKKKRT